MPRILVVEDDPVGRRVAVELVKRLGYPVDVAPDGRAAIDAVAATAYTLVLMDCQMPDVDGYMATAEIRRREAALGDRARRVPIVALTASWADADRDRCLGAGMDEYLTKPIDGQRLAALIERWAPGSRGIRRAEGSSSAPVEPPAAQVPEVRPILDPAGLLGSAVELSPQHREIVELFLAEVPRGLTMLTTAAARGDGDQVARLAHALAGSANSLGAARLAAACARLEAVARGHSEAPGLALNHGRLALTGSLAGGLLAEAIGAVHQELQELREALPDGLRGDGRESRGSPARSVDA